MAKKKPDMSDIFAKTEPEGAAEEQPDPVKSIGVGLRESEWVKFETVADELGTNRHSLAKYALRDFLRRYEAGEIQTETRKTLPDL